MKKTIIIILSIIATSCSPEKKTFPKTALNDSFETLDNQKATLKEIINKHKGKTILIDIWASWCPDCIKGLPKLAELQKEHPDVAFVFLSLDKTSEDWKNGITKHNVKGDNYFMHSGKKGGFGKFVNIDWIPCYLVINKEGEIEVFKEVLADSPKIAKALKK